MLNRGLDKLELLRIVEAVANEKSIAWGIANQLFLNKANIILTYQSENLRKRLEREKEQTRKFGIANFAKDLLSIADNLGRALDAAPNKEDVEDQAIENLVLGIQMTEQELQKAFDNNNIRKIDPLGEKFDYNFHQAMFEVEETDKEPGIVVQVLQPGYAIDDRILRPAMVGVAAAKGGKKNVAVDTKA